MAGPKPIKKKLPKLRPGSLPMDAKAAALRKHYRFYVAQGADADRAVDDAQLTLFRSGELSASAPLWTPGSPRWAPGAPDGAVPPLQQDRSERPAAKRVYPPGELLARMRKRIALTRGSSIRVRFRKVSSKKSLPSMTKLRAARSKARELGYAVRDEAFTDWITRCVVIAQRPDQWTQAAVLYDGYAKHASRYGTTNADRVVAKEELATETRWGKMMGAAYPNKVRRAKGWYYPLRLKQGA